MQNLFQKRLAPVLSGALAFALPSCALAINGMYLTGYGSESALMGGADVAVARDAFAANNNPAGMTQLRAQSAGVELQFTPDWNVNHSDEFGNYRKPRADRYAGLANGAYARRIEQSPYAAGVSMVVQGGLGWTYRGLNTRFGGRDDAASQFAVLKLSPALAWAVNDQLSLGAALGINYFGGNQEVFPNTAVNPSPAWPDLPQGFNGFRFKGASGVGINSKWGLQYRPAPDVTLAMTYGTKTAIPMQGGNLRLNLSNLGLGVVRYDDARLDGFHLPEEFAVGISFRPLPPLLVSLQDKWYGWGAALKTLTLTASSPRGAIPAPLATVSIPSVAGFTDQHVISVGLAYDLDSATTLLAGLNYGRQPIPSKNVNPIFAPIPARHCMFGATHKIDQEWRIGGGLEVYLPQSASYSSPVFGANASERNFTGVFHLSLGRNW